MFRREDIFPKNVIKNENIKYQQQNFGHIYLKRSISLESKMKFYLYISLRLLQMFLHLIQTFIQ